MCASLPSVILFLMMKKKRKRKIETTLMSINREMAKMVPWNSQPGTLCKAGLFVLIREWYEELRKSSKIY